MLKRTVAFVLAVLLMTLVFVPRAAAEEEEDDKMSLMRKKLGQTQRILEGLTTEDYELIAKNARKLNKLTVLEKWVRANTLEYKSQLSMFQQANRELIRFADEENLDGAALAYVQLTLTCVNCHKQIRAKP